MKRFYSLFLGYIYNESYGSLGLVYFFSISQFRFGSWTDLNTITFIIHPAYCLFFVSSLNRNVLSRQDFMKKVLPIHKREQLFCFSV